MLGECPDDDPASSIGSHSYFAYLTVDDVDELFAEVVARGAAVMAEPRTQPWACVSSGCARPTAIESRTAPWCRAGNKARTSEVARPAILE